MLLIWGIRPFRRDSFLSSPEDRAQPGTILLLYGNYSVFCTEDKTAPQVGRVPACRTAERRSIDTGGLVTGGEDDAHDLFGRGLQLEYLVQPVFAEFVHAVGFGGIFQILER